jgi:type III restriction enzyme
MSCRPENSNEPTRQRHRRSPEPPPPQRRSLEILDRITEIVPPEKGADLAAALEAIRSEFPTVTDFEREFPSLCFALATGVGKTRLMGAFISYLHLAHGINNFFVMAPEPDDLQQADHDFTPNTPSMSSRASRSSPRRAGDHHGRQLRGKAGTLFDQVLRCKVNIFNISKINSEVRGRQIPAHQAALGIHRRELLRVSGEPA